ncbi:MAG: CDGSH iron-sulfur domain-containing protein [Bdellovibrionales bacterium]|nr:CDGSH iron-sulfur domain-containing protein [Bdellovibrionales bacterium]
MSSNKSDRDRKIAKAGPYILRVDPGRYLWCACGRSQTQPFCDGSHTGTSHLPIEVEFKASTRVAWCGCKCSGKAHLCDGSHNQLSEAKAMAAKRE